MDRKKADKLGFINSFLAATNDLVCCLGQISQLLHTVVPAFAK